LGILFRSRRRPVEVPMSQARVPAIHVADLRKTFFVPVREGGLRAAVRSLFRRENKAIPAVDGISFDIEPGEIVGFLGPNGAGKTTTLKMLSGLLYPTSGEVSVLGFEPSRRQSAFLRQITMVMGNRNQLQWDLPALDSYELLRAIYRLHPDDFRKTRDEFIELLDLGDLVRKPVRNLSLGERMKVETAAALLHRPTVLFLDEPTIGLDVTMQKRIRSFVAEYNQRYGATVLLTSHYMADVQALCKRVIVIHHGRILFDGDLSTLAARFGAEKTIGVTLKEGTADLTAYGEVIGEDDGKVSIRVARAAAPDVAGRILRDLAVADLTIEDPPIEDVIESVFAGASSDPAANRSDAGARFDG
jgi:ABC-2 type transport system ATP-binding protein